MRDHHTPGVTGPATRRRALAVAATVMLALPQAHADGRKNRHKARKKNRCREKAERSAEAACAQAANQCVAFFLLRCDEESRPEACRTAVTDCCARLNECNFEEYMTCLFPTSP